MAAASMSVRSISPARPGRVDRAAALREPASWWPTGDAPALGEPDAGDDRTMGEGVKCRTR